MQSADVKHILVTSGDVLGPYETSEVIRIFKKYPKIFHSILWIAPEGKTPVLVVEWFSDFAPEGALEELLAADVPQDMQSIAFQQYGKKAELPPDHGGLAPAQLIQGRRSLIRDWLALLCLAILGAGLVWLGVKTLRPAKTFIKQEKNLAAQLLGATPDSLKNYQNLLEGKITRDSKKYALSLVAMQKDRAIYPEGFLPSGELTAAIALVNISHEELERISEWKQLLLRLPAETRQRGLAVVAYELSRVFAIRKNLLPLTLKKEGKASRAYLIKRSQEEIDIVLERIVRVVPSSEPEEKILHGLLLSRLLSLSLVTLLENPQMIAGSEHLKQSIDGLPALYPFLSTADKAIVGELSEIIKGKMSTQKSKVNWSQSLQRLVELNQSTQFMCQLNESGAGTDAVLFFLAQAASEKQSIPELSKLFESCFVGLRMYPRTSSFSMQGEGTAVTEFASSGPIDEILLRNFRGKFPTFNPALNTLKGSRSSVGEWMLALYQNGVLSGRLTGGKNKTQLTLCGKMMAASSLCSQVLWNEMSQRWRDLIPLIPDLRDEIKPDELSLLGHHFILNAAGQVLKSRSRHKLKEISEALGAVKDFVDKDDPQLQFLFDYIQSIDLDS